MTQNQTEAGPADAPVDEDAVAEFLRVNPDFFQRHRELARDLRVPHEVGQAVSLVAFQMRALREEEQQLRLRLDDLLAVARDNDRVSDQLHRLTMDLLDATDIDGIAAVLCDGLRSEFRAEQVRLRLAVAGKGIDGVQVSGLDAEEQKSLRQVFPERRPRLGRLAEAELRLAFGEDAAQIGSAAVIPFDDDHVRGLIAVGSGDGARYHTDQGTVFLTRLGDLVGRTIRHVMPDNGQ